VKKKFLVVAEQGSTTNEMVKDNLINPALKISAEEFEMIMIENNVIENVNACNESNFYKTNTVIGYHDTAPVAASAFIEGISPIFGLFYERQMNEGKYVLFIVLMFVLEIFIFKCNAICALLSGLMYGLLRLISARMHSLYTQMAYRQRRYVFLVNDCDRRDEKIESVEKELVYVKILFFYDEQSVL